MARRLRCPRCYSSKYWIVRREKRRCARCRYEWRPARLPLRLTPQNWREILGWFVRGVRSTAVAKETGLHRERVLRALILIRKAIVCEVSRDLSGVSEISEVYPLYQTWTKRRKRGKSDRIVGGKAEGIKGFSVSYGAGKVWLETQISEEVGEKSSTLSKELKGFLGYLGRQLAGRGGIRYERIPLYVAEYIWRYNNRQFPPKEQIRKLLKLLKLQSIPGGANTTLQRRGEKLGKRNFSPKRAEQSTM